MSDVKSFSEIVDFVNARGQEIEVIIPAADSGSALGGVAAFVKSVDIPVRVNLIGIPENIEKVIAEKDLGETLNGKSVKIVPTGAMEEAFDDTLARIDRKKNQIILKGNSTSDQLMKGLLRGKEKIIDKGNIISHFRLFETPAGMVLMSDGGINVVANIKDDEKRAAMFKKLMRNSETLAPMFGINAADKLVPGEADGIGDLNEKVAPRFADIASFPGLIQFPWIGPANIVYKASASTPWEVRYEGDMKLPVSGGLELFTRPDTSSPLLIATPEKGAGFPEKKALLEAALTACGELNISRPRVALLDFTEQHATFIDTPSIGESRQLVEACEGKEAVVEGPMAFDLAVSEKAAKIKKFQSEVSGKPDVLFMPDFTAGVLLSEIYKNWKYLHLTWDGADISFGGPVPILVPSRSDTPEHKLRSVIGAAYISLHTG